MSRFLLLNLEDYGLNQDITKTIQPFNPFCICCLDREGAMFDLEKCNHSDYLEAFGRSQLKQFNQLVCLQCHNMLKKIKCFQAQVLESYQILLSGAFTDTATNNKRMNSLMIQKVVDELHLPPDIEVLNGHSIHKDLVDNQADYSKMKNCASNIDHNVADEIIINAPNLEQQFVKETQIQSNIEEDGSQMVSSFTHAIHHESNMEQQYAHEIQNDSNIAQPFNHELCNALNIEQDLCNEINEGSNFNKEEDDNFNSEQNFTHEIVGNSNIEQSYSYETENRSNINIDNDSNIQQSFTEELCDDLNMEQDLSVEICDTSNVEQDFTRNEIEKSSDMGHNFSHQTGTDSNIEDNLSNAIENDSNIEQNFSNQIPDILTEDDSVIQAQHRLNKNIKTAIEILVRNNQSFVSLGSQLQFLNGEHLSYLEPSLLSKEILTDIPLVPANLSTDLENGLLNNTKSLDIEIGPDRMFYDSLDLSPELEKETNVTNIMDHLDCSKKTQKVVEPDKKASTTRKKRNASKFDPTRYVKRVRLTHEELAKERVLQAQSEPYLRYKYRCETCIMSFIYKENLDDHVKRKHGVKEADNVVCDICSQLIPSSGHVTEHEYRHYTRYECVRCVCRFHTYDEALQHCNKKHRVNGNGAQAGFKMKRSTAKLKTKLKINASEA